MTSINVSKEELNEYCNAVARFQFDILQDLCDLVSEAEKLSSVMDEESSQTILQMVCDIAQILSENQEELNVLHTKIINYADFIHELNVKTGAIPASVPPSAYWRSKEGQKLSSVMGNVMCSLFEKVCSVSDPTGNCSEALSAFLQTSIPFLADSAKNMMAFSYEQFSSSTMQQFNRTFIMKDQDGNYITAAQARQNALSQTNTTLQSVLGKTNGAKNANK